MNKTVSEALIKKADNFTKQHMEKWSGILWDDDKITELEIKERLNNAAMPYRDIRDQMKDDDDDDDGDDDDDDDADDDADDADDDDDVSE